MAQIGVLAGRIDDEEQVVRAPDDHQVVEDAAGVRTVVRQEVGAAQFDELVRAVPFDAWELPDVTPGWTLKDHVAHLAARFEKAADALERCVTMCRARGERTPKARFAYLFPSADSALISGGA